MKIKKLFTNQSKYRCSIITILGHVDSGKTSLLDYIRKTKVNQGEAGQITQQIGASFFPKKKIMKELKKLKGDWPINNIIFPGFLIIDTPGHESFSNLRQRGSSLCDLAILVVDINQGLLPQTIESINLLKARRTPFIIAMNKVDLFYGWKKNQDASIRQTLKKQKEQVRGYFKDKLNSVVAQFAKQLLNVNLYYNKCDLEEEIPIVPTSGKTGEGIPDLLGMMSHLTERFLKEDITKEGKQFRATILEVRKIEGMGHTIDIILVNGVLQIEDRIIFQGLHGPVETQVKAILTPHPLREIRVKGEYLHH